MMSSGAEQEERLRGVPPHERHFYGSTKAIGRFGMRVFTPTAMDADHWHGHIEANMLVGASMTYEVDGERIEVPEGHLVLFWAGIPHRLTSVTPTGTAPPRLTNIYLPIDSFLLMPHIAQLQVALLGGAMMQFDPSLCSEARIAQWYSDYRANDVERNEVLKMELNALLRRGQMEGPTYLRASFAIAADNRSLTSGHIRQVIDMVKFILENLSRPISNTDVAAVTKLHRNYAMALFTQTMRIPMKKFVTRMRLLRARALLIESGCAISTVASDSGFGSTSQFYAHFKQAYGMSPHALRLRYTKMELQ